MPETRVIVTALCVSLAIGIGAVAVAAPTVEMVLLAEQSPSASTTGRKWVDLLSHLGVGGVQIRAAQPGEKLGIEAHGRKESPLYRVTGKLSGTQLILPGGQFGLSDGPKLAKWLGELGENGAAGVTQPKSAVWPARQAARGSARRLGPADRLLDQRYAGRPSGRKNLRAVEAEGRDRRRRGKSNRSRRSGAR